ncbi:MAG: DUF3841 domain-containing protein [Polaribacter sp.]|uniref:DUF3841 domain-containing protein n=1 Tax=Polaribacter sp. TaxID=1920175 RepID=UPI002F355171
MKLWTIQPIEFYDELIINGKIRCSKKNIDYHFKESYSWMIVQMENKIGKRYNKKTYPIWSWCQFKNSEYKRPDLRTSGFLPKGTKGVRIEFEKPETEILLSDFDLWHYVLNYWHIADDKKQELEFDKLLKASSLKFTDKEKYSSKLKNILESSWNKIFDMDYDSVYVADEFKRKKIQATFWTLKSTEIIKVDFFNAK